MPHRKYTGIPPRGRIGLKKSVTSKKRHYPSTAGVMEKLISGVSKLSLAPRTTTQVRRRRRVIRPSTVKPMLGFTSQSKFTAYKKASPQVKTMKRAGAPNFIQANNGVQSVAQQGFQEAYCTSWLNQADIQEMMNRTPNNVTGGPIPGTFKTNRFVIDSAQCELLITNSSLASSYVEIYDIARKRDANKTEFVATQNPLEAWKQGEWDATQGASSDYQFMRASPFDSQIFKDFFKVVKRTRVELAQGASHRHAVLLKPNHLVNASLPQFVDGDYAGLTMYTMVVFYGQPASVTSETGPAVVTTAQIALDFVGCARYKYSWIEDTTLSVYQTDSLSTLKGEQVVSIGAGDIKPNAIV